MMGDRADVIFADPNEISAFISNKCLARTRSKWVSLLGVT
jgi:hypothetical protein